MKKRFKNSIIISLAVFAMLSITFIFSGAWFTDNDSKTATITLGNKVDITAKATLPANAIVMPGSTVTINDIKGKAESESSSMYVRAKVNVESQYASLISATVSPLTTGWVQLEDYMYYSAADSLTEDSELINLTKLDAENETSALNLVLTISEDATQEELDSTYLAPNSTIEVTITFEAIQSAHTDVKTIKEIWGTSPVQPNNTELGEVSYSVDGENLILTATPKTANSTLVGWKNEEGKFVEMNIWTLENSNYLIGLFTAMELSQDSSEFNAIASKMGETFPSLRFIDSSAEPAVDHTQTFIDFLKANPNAIIDLWDLTDKDAENCLKWQNQIINQTFSSTLSNGNYTAVFNSTTSVNSTAVSGYTFEIFNEAGIAAISACTLDGVIEIPSSVTNSGESYPVVTAKVDFMNMQNPFSGSLTQVTIPSTISIIPDGMLYDCTTLEKVILPEGLLCISDNSFRSCSALKEISIPVSVTRIGNSAFNSCDVLENVSIPDNSCIQSLGAGAFAGCYALPSIYLPNGILTLEGNVFSSCIKLINIELPTTLESIGYNAFYNCRSLTQIVIPESVTYIGKEAFWSCEALKNITFENSTGWYVNSSTADFEQSAGTSVTVNAGTDENATQANATLLTSTYHSYYWRKF